MVILDKEFLVKKYGKDKIKELKEIDLSKERITEIDSNTFKGLIKLEKIDLSENEIAEIEEKAFEGLSNLQIVWLFNNKLKRINSTTFRGLTKLEVVLLHENEIEHIDSNAFESLSSLHCLFLNNNKLKTIDSSTFKGLSKLEGLLLSHNEIVEIGEKLFESLSNLEYLTLNNNKLKRLHSTAFRRLAKLEFLSLYHNKIADIDEKLFECLSNLEYVTLNNNRLKGINKGCLDSLKSAKFISLYENNFKVLSFCNLSESEFEEIEDEDCDDLPFLKEIKGEFINIKKYGFKTSWNDFLEQFPQSIAISSKNDGLIGELVKGKYRVKSVVGEGAFGKVYRVVDENEPNAIEKAMKTVKKDEDWDERNDEKEVDLMKRIKHENIIKYLEHFDMFFTVFGSEYFCVVCELCENGDLKEQIKEAKTSGKRIPELKIARWIIEATTGLKYLHDEKIIHRDIKPANILLTKDDVIKLADFGLSKYLESSMMSTFSGTIAYMSPQLIQSRFLDTKYTKKTDIWSMGCVLFELVELKVAFPSGPKITTRSLPDLGTSRFVPILKKMFEWEETNRMDAQTLLSELVTQRKKIEDSYRMHHF